jgi:hypothetical protein
MNTGTLPWPLSRGVRAGLGPGARLNRVPPLRTISPECSNGGGLIVLKRGRKVGRARF